MGALKLCEGNQTSKTGTTQRRERLMMGMPRETNNHDKI